MGIKLKKTIWFKKLKDLKITLINEFHSKPKYSY